MHAPRSIRVVFLQAATLPVVAVLTGSFAVARAEAPVAKQPVSISNALTLRRTADGRIDVGRGAFGIANASRSISVLPLMSPPLAGFRPQIVIGLTEEEKSDDFDWYSQPAGPISSTTLPTPATRKYFVATYDTGANAHVITADTAAAFNITSAHLGGDPNNPQIIIGANGTETGIATDALGIYATSVQKVATISGGNITAVQPNSLYGHYNSSVIVLDNPDSGLPNIIGTPMTGLFRTVINNSKTVHLTVGNQTYKTPEVAFQAQAGTLNTGGYSRVTCSLVPSGNFTDPPSFFPNFSTLDHDNPSLPTFWASMMTGATVTDGGNAFTEQFLFDTGAEVSAISENVANNMGIVLPDPDNGVAGTTPDFYVPISGVGDPTDPNDDPPSYPGYFIDQFKFTGTLGIPFSTFTNVPVVVIDLPDPRDPTHQTLPGIIGMNLFSDRDLIIDTKGNAPFFAFTAPLTAQWNVATGGSWSDDSKWMLGAPLEQDAPANFLGMITSAQTITVPAAGVVAGSIKFDNANRYTIAGGTVTLSAFLKNSTIDVVSGSHTISAPVTLENNTTITITPAASVLTMSGDFNGGTTTLTKNGAGMVAMKHVRADGLSVNQGTVSILSNGTNTGASRVKSLALANGPTLFGTLDLNNNDLLITGGASKSAVEGMVRRAYNFSNWNAPGLTSSAARSNNITTLGVMSGQEYSNNSGGNSNFDGFSVAAGDVLVKYTYFGDVDFNGQVDTTDYNIIDFGFLTGASGWANGDVDYNGQVDTTDYNLIDFAFLVQNGMLRRGISYLDGSDQSMNGMDDPSLQKIVEHINRFGESYAIGLLAQVPEPASGVLILGSALGLFASRKRRFR